MSHFRHFTLGISVFVNENTTIIIHSDESIYQRGIEYDVYFLFWHRQFIRVMATQNLGNPTVFGKDTVYNGSYNPDGVAGTNWFEEK